MIIVEGPDGAGKTTLVQHLAGKFDIPIAPKVVGSDTKPLIEDLKYWVEANLKKGLQWQIFDRHRLISGPIYATSMGRRPSPGFDDVQWFTARMIDFTRIHPFIVYCLPSYSVIEANLKDDESNVVVWGYMQQVYPAYIAQAAGDIARGQAVLFDYTHDPAYSRIDMLFELWQKNHRSRLMRLADWTAPV